MSVEEVTNIENEEVTESTESEREGGESAASKAEGFSQEEVNKRIEQARRQEKDKLYGTIEELKGKVSTLTELQKKEQETAERLEQEAKDQAEQERQAKLSSEERFAEQLKKIEEQLVLEREARERLEQDAEEERRLHSLDKYKADLLRDAGDEIIPELVTGDSREEIERNAALARDRYQQIFDLTTEKAKGNIPKMPGPSNPDDEPLEEAELAKEDLDIDIDRYYGNRAKGIRRDDEYRAQIRARRAQLFDKIGTAYKKATG